MSTYLNKKVRAFKAAGDGTLARKRSDGRMKSHGSAVDTRCWTTDEEDQRQYILELVKQHHGSLVSGKFIPLDALIEVILNQKNAIIYDLEQQLQKLKQFLDTLNLTAEQKAKLQSILASQPKVHTPQQPPQIKTQSSDGETLIRTQNLSEPVPSSGPSKTMTTPPSNVASDKASASTPPPNNIETSKESTEPEASGGVPNVLTVEQPSTADRTIEESLSTGPAVSKVGSDSSTPMNLTHLAQEAVQKLETIKGIVNDGAKTSGGDTNLREQAATRRPSYIVNEIVELEKQVAEMRKRNLSPEEEVDLIRKEVEVLKKYTLQFSEIQKENYDLKAEIQRLKASNAGGSGVDTQMANIKEKLAKLDELVAERDKLLLKVRQLENQVYGGNSSNGMPIDSAIEIELSQRLKQLSGIEEEVRRLKAKADRCRELSDQLESSETQSLNEKNDLMCKCKRAERAAGALEEEQCMLKKEIHRKSNEINELKCKCRDADNLRREYEYLKCQLNRNMCDLIEARKNLDEAQRQLKRMHELELDNARLMEIADRAEEIEKQKAELEAMLDQCKCHMTCQDKEINNLHYKIDEVKQNKCRQQDVMKSALTTMRARLEDKNNIMLESQQKLADVQDELRTSIEGLTCETNCLKEYIKKLERKLGKSEEELDNAKKTVEKLNRERYRMSCQCHQTGGVAENRDLDMLENEKLLNRNLKQRINELEGQLKCAQSTVADMKSKLCRYENVCQENDQLRRLSTTLQADANQKINELEAKLDERRQSTKELEDALRQQTETMSKQDQPKESKEQMVETEPQPPKKKVCCMCKKALDRLAREGQQMVQSDQEEEQVPIVPVVTASIPDQVSDRPGVVEKPVLPQTPPTIERPISPTNIPKEPKPSSVEQVQKEQQPEVVVPTVPATVSKPVIETLDDGPKPLIEEKSELPEPSKPSEPPQATKPNGTLEPSIPKGPPVASIPSIPIEPSSSSPPKAEDGPIAISGPSEQVPEEKVKPAVVNTPKIAEGEPPKAPLVPPPPPAQQLPELPPPSAEIPPPAPLPPPPEEHVHSDVKVEEQPKMPIVAPPKPATPSTTIVDVGVSDIAPKPIPTDVKQLPQEVASSAPVDNIIDDLTKRLAEGEDKLKECEEKLKAANQNRTVDDLNNEIAELKRKLQSGEPTPAPIIKNVDHQALSGGDDDANALREKIRQMAEEMAKEKRKCAEQIDAIKQEKEKIINNLRSRTRLSIDRYNKSQEKNIEMGDEIKRLNEVIKRSQTSVERVSSQVAESSEPISSEPQSKTSTTAEESKEDTSQEQSSQDACLCLRDDPYKKQFMSPEKQIMLRTVNRYNDRVSRIRKQLNPLIQSLMQNLKDEQQKKNDLQFKYKNQTMFTELLWKEVVTMRKIIMALKSRVANSPSLDDLRNIASSELSNEDQNMCCLTGCKGSLERNSPPGTEVMAKVSSCYTEVIKKKITYCVGSCPCNPGKGKKKSCTHKK